MTQTPEPDDHYHVTGIAMTTDGGAPRSFKLDVESGPTEMGFMVQIHSLPANITVEFDLDWDPEYLNGLIQCLPELIAHRMAMQEEEQSRSSTTAEMVDPSISAQHGS